MVANIDGLEQCLRAARSEVGGGNNSFVYVQDETDIPPANQGILQGMPIAVKDVIDCAGQPTLFGTAGFVGIPEVSATIVKKLVDSGARIIGKTHTHQFAFGTTGDIAATGPVTNPFDPTKMAGGSSGGSAVAVSKGIVRAALGTDTAGSVRIPAALVGCVGFKPTWDVIPMEGIMPLSPTLDAPGIVTDRVATLKDVWFALLGTAKDFGPRTASESELVLFNLGNLSQVHLSSRIRRHWDSALKILEERFTVKEYNFALELDSLRASYRTIIGYESLQVHSKLLDSRPEIYDRQIRERIENLAGVTESDYDSALHSRRNMRQDFEQSFSRSHLFIMPTVGIETPLIGQREVTDDSGIKAVWGGLADNTCPWNVLGFPAISIPLPRAKGEMPIGMQIVGFPGTDDYVIDVAEQIEALFEEPDHTG